MHIHKSRDYLQAEIDQLNQEIGDLKAQNLIMRRILEKIRIDTQGFSEETLKEFSDRRKSVS